MDALDATAARQKAVARLANDFVDSIGIAIEKFGSGASFPFNDGECRVMQESGISRIDYVSQGGLVWRLTASGGPWGEVSLSPTKDEWYERNTARNETVAALRALTDALWGDRFMRSAATDVPTLCETPLPLPERNLGDKEPFLDQGLAWRQLDRLITEKGSNGTLLLRTTTDAQVMERGYHQLIRVIRHPNGDICVEEGLPPRAKGFSGPHFVVPNAPDGMIVFYPHMDNSVTQILDQSKNLSLLNSWLSSVKSVSS